MSPSRSFALAALLLLPGCEPSSAPGDTDGDATAVEAQEVDGVWVFTYAEAPDASMDALATGTASVVDGCLLVGDAVVVWHDHHLDDVNDAIAGVDRGEVVSLQVGGGGLSLDEGSSEDDFPPLVVEHCSPTEVWFSSDQELVVE